MKIAGQNTVAAPVEEVWQAILDPQVLVATIPGCERLVATGEHTYDMTVTAGVASIKGTYTGSCALFDLEDHKSLTMRLSGAGAPGTVDATVGVSFEDLGPEGTRISYDADATVGGMVGGVGQRMLTSVSRRMAGEFFGNVGRAISSPPTAEASGGAADDAGTTATGAVAGTTGAAAPASAAGVFTAPARPAAGGQEDFLKGVAVGAGLVLLGVLAGARLGRR